MELKKFLSALSSKEPVPGGGGASALSAALGSALCSMVVNLTSGKKKYAEYQPELDKLCERTETLTQKLFSFIEKDAEAFAPLAAAYGIPKDTPGREETLENALKTACTVPAELLAVLVGAVDILERLCVIGSRLAISDVGVAATLCRAGAEGAAMNVYINTKLMKNRAYADNVNEHTDIVLTDIIRRCGAVYQTVLTGLR